MNHTELIGRRAFIRILGGSVVSAAVPLAGCSTDFPADAVADWQGPPAGADLRRWALAHAILAPNSHNRQPWLVDLREPDARPVARVSWAGLAPTLVAADPLFAQILRRHTAKVDYDTSRPVAPATLESLRGALVDPAVLYGATVDPARRDALR